VLKNFFFLIFSSPRTKKKTTDDNLVGKPNKPLVLTHLENNNNNPTHLKKQIKIFCKINFLGFYCSAKIQNVFLFQPRKFLNINFKYVGDIGVKIKVNFYLKSPVTLVKMGRERKKPNFGHHLLLFIL
jgi:hypothetical protein